MRNPNPLSIRQLFLCCLAALLLISQALAQNPDSPVQTPRQGGGGGGFGISIDIGSVINAIRDRNKDNQKCDPEIERGARFQFQNSPQAGVTLEQYIAKACNERSAANVQRSAVITTLSNQRSNTRGTPQGETCAVNGGFETSDFSSWSGANNGSLPRNQASLKNITTLGISSGAINLDNAHQTIVSSGNDPILGTLLQQVRPGSGNSAARLGNTFRDPSYYAGYGAELLAKSFKVSAANAIVGFSYALVLADGGSSHKPGGTAINPRFMVRVLDSSGNEITNNIPGGRVRLNSSATPNIIEADVNNPYFKSFTMPAYVPAGTQSTITPVLAYKDWSCAEINLADLIGQDVTIEFITQDCDASGHFAYAYVDDFCSTCAPGPEGSIQAAPFDECGVGKICVDITVPKSGTQIGQATVSLDIWQNGIKLTTLNQPAINADGKVCFPINPSTIAGLDTSKGFDYSAKADLKIGSFTLPSKLLGAGPNGVKPDRNNDYQSTCAPNGGGGTCGTPSQPPCPTCGQEGQSPCPTCGQPGQPLCPDICTPSNPTGNSNAATASNRLGNFLGNLRNAARGTAGKPAALEKKALAVGNSVNGNYTINWVVSYANTSNQALSNVIVRDGPIATIIPGSLQQPAGWTGATNAASGNTPADNYAQWNGAIVPPHGVITQTVPPLLPKTINTSGGGDGYQPIPYTRISTPSGQRVYVMNHHEKPGYPLFRCFDVVAGTDCPGWSNGKPLPIGDNSLDASGSLTTNPEYIILSGKLYYASMGNTTATGMGMGCYDLETDTPCGYTRLDSRPSGTHLNGPWQVGNELYFASNEGHLYCAKLSSGFAPCLSTGYKIPKTTIEVYVAKTNTDNWNTNSLAGKVVGSKLFVTNIRSGKKYANCFDSTTKAACWGSNFTTKGTAAYSYSFASGNYTNFIYYNTALNEQAICSMSTSPAGQFCVELATGNSYSAPNVVLPGLNMLGGLENYYQGKSYFVNFNFANSLDDAYCWDWSKGAACTTAVTGKIALSPVTRPENYGLNVDDNGCMWVYGDEGVLWNFNPNNIDAQTGLAKPCGGDPGKAQLTFQPLQYCSGPKPFKWTAVEVKGTTLADMDKLIVKVLDATTNAVLFTKDLKAGGALATAITSINLQTESKPLKIELEYTPKAGTNDKPYVEVRYDAPALEFCFTSSHTCAQGNITNNVETQDPLNLSSIISASATVAKPQDCPCISCGTANTPSCATCGQAGQPVCPPCGQPGQLPCGTCGGAGQSPCTSCGGIGQAPCTDGPGCIPGTPGCPIIVIGGCIPGTPGCGVVRPPPSGVCLTGNCDIEKPKQSVAEEFKEPKVSCVRKPKDAEEAKKPPQPKPKPKPVAVNPAPKPVADVEAKPAAPKPAPKPRPKPAPKPKAQDDDDC